jgi:hypothetical protein
MQRMAELLIFVGEATPRDRRERVQQFLSNNEIFTAFCHIADNLWAARARVSCKDVFDQLVALQDSTTKIIVAPIDGYWEAANCTSAFDCFRSDY